MADKTEQSDQPRAEPAAGTQPDRRRHPRVYEDLPAEVGLADERTLKVAVQSMGLGGVRLVCGEEDMRRIKAEGFPALHGETVEVELHASLPTYDRAPEPLAATCRLVYTRRVAQQRYCLGMQFTGFTGDSRAALMRYLLDAPGRP